jgi:hypothetical protein
MRGSILWLVAVLAGCGAESPEDWSWADPPPLCPTDRRACAPPTDWTEDESLSSEPDAGPCAEVDCSTEGLMPEALTGRRPGRARSMPAAHKRGALARVAQ